MLTRSAARNVALFVMIIGAILALFTGVTLCMLLLNHSGNTRGLVVLTITSGCCACIFGTVGNYFRIRNLPSPMNRADQPRR